MSKDQLEKLLWSIALPGFGQLLNHKYIKGILFILLEFLVNVQSNLNTAILLSFHGDIQSAIDQSNYQWLLFYPCLYLFAIWDAFKDAEGESTPLMFLPFVCSAYFVTIGVIYSFKMTIFGILFGPIFLPILCVIPGVLIGIISKKLLLKIMV